MLRRVLAAILVAVLLLGIGLFLFRRPLTDAMLFYPDHGQGRSPDDVGLAYESLWVEASDGVRTEAWWIPAGPDAPVILFFHGNAGTISDRLENAAELHGRGASVLLAEYRGYGNSGGKPSEQGFYRDARAALAVARERAGDAPVVVFGRSLGGAVAIDVASRERVDGLVVESSFTSLGEMAKRAVSVPFASVLAAYDFDSVAKIGRVTVPVLVIHGEDDELVPMEMGRRLYEAARGAPWRRIHAVEGGDHDSTLAVGGEAYWEAWKAFLATVEHRAEEPRR
jgi:hypothetical protein